MPALLDGGDVDERVMAAVIGLDEAKALGLVEEFYGADDGMIIFLLSGGPPIGPPALGAAKRRNEEPQSA